MAEQWISAAKALEIVGDRFVLCERLNAGLAIARANLILAGDKPHHNKPIPAKFWWGTGHAALDQDWDAGDFSTLIDRDERWKVFGVSIELAGVLAAIDFERRAAIARSLSVAGNAKWITAAQARAFGYNSLGFSPTLASYGIIEHAKLGFVTARAVLAQGSDGTNEAFGWSWEEREWDIPDWFWTGFTSSEMSNQEWATGKFSGRGLAPDRTRWITLTGVYFLRESLQAMLPTNASDELTDEKSAEPSTRGRRNEYDWPGAINAIWGQLNRGQLIPQVQADIELALMKHLKKGDKEPSQSTARPFAKPIWEEFLKP